MSYFSLGTNAYFWTGTELSSGSMNAYYHYLTSSSETVGSSNMYKRYGLSVRCVRDPLTLPSVSTNAATDVTSTSATLVATITNPDDVGVTGKGFEWKATEGVTYESLTGTGTGNGYTADLTGLSPNTSYTYRAFVSYYGATVYGAEMEFTTEEASSQEPTVLSSTPCTIPNEHPAQTAAQGYTVSGTNHGLETLTNDGKINSVTDYDGNEYPVVQIGSQCWLAENMRCTHSPSTGTYIVNNEFTSGENITCTYTGKMARWYNNDSLSFATMNYGLLYNWNAAVDTFNVSYAEKSVNDDYDKAVVVTFSENRQGICPNGWHVPSDAEWTQMTDEVGDESEFRCDNVISYIGKALASQTGWSVSSASETCAVDNDLTANNQTGFNALPAGEYTYAGFGYYQTSTGFWSVSQAASGRAYYRVLVSSSAVVSRENDLKRDGFSVRCVRD